TAPRTDVFTRVLRAIAAGVLCGAAAVVLYPGGTRLDDTTSGYQMAGNFLSDLGRTAAYNGDANTAGAVLFALCIGELLIGFGIFLAYAARLHRATPAQRWMRGALAAGVVVVLLFSGVALTPDDEFRRLHSQFA